MKKRLLSAALALAMVLTMLPLSVMAAPAPSWVAPTANTGVAPITWNELTSSSASMSLTYYKANTTFSGHTIKVNGWYAIVNQNGTNVGYGIAEGKGPGVITGIGGGTWYPNLQTAIATKATNLVLLSGDSGTTLDLTPNTVSSLTIDLNGFTLGGALTIPGTYVPTTGGPAQPNTFSQLTIKDSTKSGSTYTANSAPAINVGASGNPKNSSTIINLNNVGVGAVNAYYTTNCTVNVYGSKTGNIQLNGTSGGAITLGNGTTRGWADGVSLTTTGTAQGGTITATDAGVSSITLSGVGASLTGTNLTVSGTVTLGDLSSGTLSENDKSNLNTPTATLYNSKVGSITQGTNQLTKNYTVNLHNNTQVNGITLNNANVTVNNSAAGPITVKNGDVKLNGSATGPASAGNVQLGDNNAAASLTVTGTNVTTGAISKSGNGTVNVTVPESDTNRFTSLGPGIDNRGISGGVWGDKVPTNNLNLNLRYRSLSNRWYQYYSDSQFQNVLDAYQVGKDTSISDAAITLVRDPQADTAKNTITFKNGDNVLAVVKYGTPSLPLVLPSSVNGLTVLKWSEYDTTGKLLSEPVPGTTYSTPTDNSNRVLNAQATDNTITKLAYVKSNIDGVTARLNGNVITLSGAVRANNTTITVHVTTDGNPAEARNIVVLYDNGKVTFSNQNGSLPPAMRISNDYTTLIIGNGSASYTLNGSGLRVLADGLQGNKVHGYTGDLPVIVTVNCSGTGWTTVRKAALANFMTNDATAFGAALTFDAGKSSKVSFANSPAVKEALNAAVAGITQSQIESWILNAQNAAWRAAGNTSTPTAVQRAGTGYNEVHVVAYMAVDITNYNTANKPGTMTMTLTPSYYVEVTGSGGNKNVASKLDPNKATELNALRPVNNRSLGSLTGEMGDGTANAGVTLTLQTESDFDLTNPVAHQGGIYAYPSKGAGKLEFRIFHTLNNALGQFIVNGEGGMVSLYAVKGNPGSIKGTYDTLQAAVDDAKDGWYIDVDANYKGGCNITVTGTARKFTINTHGANKVTSNVSGVVTELAGGNEYEVQLVRDSVVSGTTTITVGSATGGTMTANTASTRPGQTVTLTATPSAGYRVGTPTVRTNTGAAVSVSTVGTNTFSFVVPTGATSITVSPSFVWIATTSLPFNDVAATAWYYGGVEYCYNTVRGSSRLMQGMNDANTVFSPNSGFTRAQVVQILWNIKGRPTPRNTYSRFSDISSIHYAYNAMLWAVQNGYTEGYPDGTFRPNQYVTRQEMAVFLWRAAGKPTGYNTLNLNNYSDGNQVYDWAQPAMRWAVATGVLSGQGSVAVGRYLAPRAVAYRSEVAVTVMNFDKLAVFR